MSQDSASHTSTRSSMKARRTALAVKVTMMKEKHRLEAQRAEFERQQEEHEFQTVIAMIEAEEEVLEEEANEQAAERGTMGRKDKITPSSPREQQPVPEDVRSGTSASRYHPL